MSLSVRCGNCDAKYPKVPEKFAGRSILCKKCGEKIRIPKAAGAEIDPWDVGDDDFGATLPPTTAPPRAGGTASPGRKPGKRKGSGMPTWVWWLIGGGVAVVIGCCGIAGVVGVALPTIQRQAVVRSEEQSFAGLETLFNDLIATLASVTDAASAQAAVAKIDGPLTQRLEALRVKVQAADESRRKLPISQKEPIETAEREMRERYEPKFDQAKRQLQEQSARLRGLPPDVAPQVGMALMRFGNKIQSLDPARGMRR